MPRKTLMLMGVLLILVEISGVPGAWKSTFAIFVGIIAVIIALKRAKISESDSGKSDAPVSSAEQTDNSREDSLTQSTQK